MTLDRKLIKILEIVFYYLAALLVYWPSKLSNRARPGPMDLNFIVEEFFHPDLRGVGGFGKLVKNVADYFNAREKEFRVGVALPQKITVVNKPSVRRYHNSNVYLHSAAGQEKLAAFWSYARLLNYPRPKLFFAIEYYSTYEYPLLASPAVPLLIWIQDPRDREEWEKLAQLKLEVQSRPFDNIMSLASEREYSLKKIIRLSRILKRKVIFATCGEFLTERARRTYNMPTLQAHYLPSPLSLPELSEIIYAPRPSFCYVGRWDPVKRPWIFFELAKRMPGIDFYVVGHTHFFELMEPMIAPYRKLPNLKFLGLVDEATKEKLLRETWALINTSLHEGLPVSFLEAFSYGKCVISCQNPDGLAERFGYYTGEILGEGLDEDSVRKFTEKIERFVADDFVRKVNGPLARKYVEENHTFKNFERRLQAILIKEGISG